MAAYLVDAKTEIRRHALDGTPDGEVELPGIGSAGIRGTLDDDEAFLVFTSFNAPTTIYRYDVATKARTVWAQPKVKFDLTAIEVEQHFYASKDGTTMPMFVVRRRDVQAPAPTLLYGYGGYGISMTPYYAPTQLSWVAQGGVLAIANIRGGGEYGKAWHDAGRLANKQNSFDDFIAAAEHLRDTGIAGADGIAIQEIERRTAGRGRGEPAPGPVRRGLAGRRGAGPAALPPFHRRELLDVRLRGSAG